ncbi:serine hydrolase [Allokutzneria sp. NRRL B-24872]|uniref:serine hydrolase domain-containing protein n=1 Tax=Allokutzneria sp. NRRL B-24872 TaxID=1137961 RepID=UPI000A3B0A40|nr:serine hydrolase domain-containing protein [Allokutzneria sp. NRRL B-24872]
MSRIKLIACGTVAALGLGAGSAAALPDDLKSTLDAVHSEGMPGVFAEVRDGRTVWRGAAGVADLATGRPVTADMRHRVGSVTKTFTAAAVLLQVEQGRLRLDAPIGDYLPHLVPGERGRAITVRMLINHTSGLADYLTIAFPSLAEMQPKSLDDNRFRRFRANELIAMGVNAPPAGEPGSTPGVYSNTNYLLLGQLLRKVTGRPAEEVITRTVIDRAGLRHTEFPDGTRIRGPHSRMYESLFGAIDPPRDYSVYDMSWVSTGAALVTTMADLNHFYAQLLSGKIVKPGSLAQMQRTVPVISLEGNQIDYGLGLHKVTTSCGTFWGHDGSVWGAQALSLTSADGRRQLSYALNLAHWTKLDRLDQALESFTQKALCAGRIR